MNGLDPPLPRAEPEASEVGSESRPVRDFVRRFWRLGVAIGLISALLVNIGLDELRGTLAAVSPFRMLAVLLLLYVWLLLGACKVWRLLRRLHTLPLRGFLPAYLAAWSTSLLLPGQLGDATQMLFLRERGVSMTSSGAAYVVDKVVSFGWMFAVTLWGLFHYFPSLALRGLLAVGLLGGAGLIGIALLHRVARWRGTWMDRWLERLRRLGEEIALFSRHPGSLLANLLLTVLKWLLLLPIYRLAFAAFGVEIHWVDAAILPVMSSLVAYLPISVGGAGAMEWTAVALFARVGVAAADVLCAYLVIRVGLLGTALLLLLATRPRSRASG